ncbi:MAG: sensor histidine kinase [Streptosporangiales bacterium]|nr:sensor histidine kinase [Streptosporangiales bacterium]
MRVPRPRTGDIVLAAAVTLLALVSTHFTDIASPADRPVDALAYALAATSGVLLVFRRTWPLPVMAATILLTSTYLTLGYPYAFIMLTGAITVYTVARQLPLSRSVPASLAALPVLLVHVLVHEGAAPGLLSLAPGSAWIAVPFAAGVAVRFNRESAARDRAEQIREHVYDERLRVAQEVHDVVGHGLAAIKMQADVGLHLLAKKPEQAEQALTTISRTSAEALEELRATLAVVRQSDAEQDRTPSPGLDRLDELTQRMGTAGLDVHLEKTGQPRKLSAAVDLAGYRVVQEALTNVLRHSGAKVASVRVEYDTDAVIIAVANPLTDRPAEPADANGRRGLGITGMRQRVTALGGEFSAGATATGGFEVHATIPTGEHP